MTEDRKTTEHTETETTEEVRQTPDGNESAMAGRERDPEDDTTDDREDRREDRRDDRREDRQDDREDR